MFLLSRLVLFPACQVSEGRKEGVVGVIKKQWNVNKHDNNVTQPTLHGTTVSVLRVTASLTVNTTCVMKLNKMESTEQTLFTVAWYLKCAYHVIYFPQVKVSKIIRLEYLLESFLIIRLETCTFYSE